MNGMLRICRHQLLGDIHPWKKLGRANWQQNVWNSLETVCRHAISVNVTSCFFANLLMLSSANHHRVANLNPRGFPLHTVALVHAWVQQPVVLSVGLGGWLRGCLTAWIHVRWSGQLFCSGKNSGGNRKVKAVSTVSEF